MDLSRAAITKRVNALIAKGVISRFTIGIEPKSLGLDITVLFELSTLPMCTRAVFQALEKQPEVGELLMTGTTSIFAFAYFKDSTHLNQFLMQVVSRIDGIQEINTNVILAFSKGNSLIGTGRV